MAARRVLVALIVLLVAFGLGLLLVCVLAPGGWTLPKLIMLASFMGTAPWTGLCFANAVIGFVLLLRQPRDVGDAHSGQSPLPTVAIVTTVRDEDMRRVLPSLRHLLHDLDAGGTGVQSRCSSCPIPSAPKPQRPNNALWRHFARRIATRAAYITAGAR